MLETWFPVVLLALESSQVIGLRLAKLVGGDVDARHEVHLMVTEKIDAVVEVSAALLGGASASEVCSGPNVCQLRARFVSPVQAMAANVRRSSNGFRSWKSN
jgi:hypothetical protein